MAKLAYTGFENHAFFPYPPNFSLKETLEFLTDVVITENGSEDRTILRKVARQSFEYKIRVNAKLRSTVSNLLDQNIRGGWAVPMWHEAQKVASVSGTTIAVDCYVSDFRVGNLVAIFRSMEDWEIRRVTAVNPLLGQITVDTTVSTMTNVYVVPVSKAIISGDVSTNVMTRATEFDFKFLMKNPVSKDKYLSVCITPHCSATAPDTLQNPETIRILEVLRGLAVNSGYKIDLRLYFWNDINRPRYDYYDMVDADFDDAVARVNAITYQAGTIPDNAATWGLDWFQTENPNPNDGSRQDIWFFMIHQAATSLTSAAATLADMIDRVAPFDGYSEVDIYGLVYNQTTSIQIIKIDNVDHNLIPNTTSSDEYAVSDRVNAALLDYDAGYRFENYEILAPEPSGSGLQFSKTFNRREDMIDFGGVFEVSSPWTYGRIQAGHSFMTFDLDQMLALRKFFYRSHGRGRLLMVPTYSYELDVSLVDLSDTRITVTNSDINIFSEDRTMIVTKEKNGTFRGYNISSTEDLGDTMRITLDRPLRNPADITFYTFAGIGRLDSDSIELSWGPEKVCETQIMTVEISK